MTHTPPIPAGNTSPYPLRELPHTRAEHTSSAIKEHKGEETERKPLTMLLMGGVMIVGIAATMTGLLFARRAQDESGSQSGVLKASRRSK